MNHIISAPIRRKTIYLASALCGATATTGIAVMASSDLEKPVGEVLPIALRSAPVDYGPGPGRGRPKVVVHPGRRVPTGLRPSLAGNPTPAGSVSSITMTVKGSYASAPGCAIDPPALAGGVQATCTPSAFAVSVWPLAGATPGSRYLANDILTMTAPGLTCGIYPMVRVTSLGSNGAVKGVTQITAGLCSGFPTTGSYTFTGGAGSGFSIPTGNNGIHWQIIFTGVSGGSGYTSVPTVTFQTSPFSTATGAATAAGTATITPPVPAPAPVPAGGPTAGNQGVFGSPITWPINAVHMALLPDGRVLNYGTDQSGNQGAQFLYDVWDPSLGTDLGTHLVLPNGTMTDIFCSASSMMWTTGQVMISGGDLTVNGGRNYANNQTTLFSPGANALSTGVQMNFPRWYAALVPLPNGDKLVMGGSTTIVPAGSAPVPKASIPELYDPATGWVSLPGANSTITDWYYPKAFVAPAGNVIEVSWANGIFNIGTGGTGSIQHYNGISLPGNPYLPTVMYAPGKLLSVRSQSVVTIDINGPTPIVTQTAPLDQIRNDGNATVLADGTVLVNGGSTVANQLASAAYTTQIWSPSTGQWTTGAAAQKPRLYHGNALLLQDGSVLTAGGGAPGPVNNLNAEIYYPPYLYLNDGSGNPAPRPAILSTLAQGGVHVGKPLTLVMGDMNPITRVTLVRAGTASHSTNIEQRFLDLTPTMGQIGQLVTVTLPVNANVALPGYWLVFAFNQAGVPSVAQQVLVTN
jgi:hypothetical protein